MSLIDDIKRDRRIMAAKTNLDVSWWDAKNRLAARVPDMEAALLAAEEMRRLAQDYYNPSGPDSDFSDAIDAYDKAAGRNE